MACGLTVASVDTFRIADFEDGVEVVNAADLRDMVSGSLEVRIVRVISAVFIGLAQVQTLMRLFPRRKEKLIIKWLGFSLILCDLIFNCLNDFTGPAPPEGSPTHYQDAIPAISYLFQFAISLLYLAWVTYYIVTKKQYAFFVPDQLNMLIIALFSMISISIPTAFFVSDISVPRVAGWGDFLRWVGAAASSILVWEWVDRIEAVEREEKKDGILGREVFDEDELPTSENRRSSINDRRGSGGDRDPTNARSSLGRFGSQLKLGELARGLSRKRRRVRRAIGAGGEKTSSSLELEQTSSGSMVSGSDAGNTADKDQRLQQTGATSPLPRIDTSSADSTIYAVVYHPVTVTTPTLPTQVEGEAARREFQVLRDREVTFASEPIHATSPRPKPSKATYRNFLPSTVPGWTFASTAFKQSKQSPPIEVKHALSIDASDELDAQAPAKTKKKSRGRLSVLRPRLGDNGGPENLSAAEASALPPMVIPAPPRGQTWSPGFSRHSPVTPLQDSGSTSQMHVNPALLQRGPPVSTSHPVTFHERNAAQGNVAGDSMSSPRSGPTSDAAPPHGVDALDEDIRSLSTEGDDRSRDG